MIRTSGLTKTFTTQAGELNILNDINLNISPGEFIAIMGASGAGKSTLLHILGTLDKPTSGTVELDGQDAFTMPEKKLTEFRNSTIGFVFQFHHLLPEFTAIENAMMPAFISGKNNRKSALIKAKSLLDELGLKHRVNHRPGELSGGEQQRVAVARALIMEPKIILADEPTGNLDATTGNDLFEILREVNQKKGTTFVVVTHNVALANQCHRTLVMEDGSIKL